MGRWTRRRGGWELARRIVPCAGRGYPVTHTVLYGVTCADRLQHEGDRLRGDRRIAALEYVVHPLTYAGHEVSHIPGSM